MTTNQTPAAFQRQKTIADLVESMRTAQRIARKKRSRILRQRAVVEQAPKNVGVWKGGC